MLKTLTITLILLFTVSFVFYKFVFKSDSKDNYMMHHVKQSTPVYIPSQSTPVYIPMKKQNISESFAFNAPPVLNDTGISCELYCQTIENLFRSALRAEVTKTNPPRPYTLSTATDVVSAIGSTFEASGKIPGCNSSLTVSTPFKVLTINGHRYTFDKSNNLVSGTTVTNPFPVSYVPPTGTLSVPCTWVNILDVISKTVINAGIKENKVFPISYETINSDISELSNFAAQNPSSSILDTSKGSDEIAIISQFRSGAITNLVIEGRGPTDITGIIGSDAFINSNVDYRREGMLIRSIVGVYSTPYLVKDISYLKTRKQFINPASQTSYMNILAPAGKEWIVSSYGPTTAKSTIPFLKFASGCNMVIPLKARYNPFQIRTYKSSNLNANNFRNMLSELARKLYTQNRYFKAITDPNISFGTLPTYTTSDISPGEQQYNCEVAMNFYGKQLCKSLHINGKIYIFDAFTNQLKNIVKADDATTQVAPDTPQLPFLIILNGLRAAFNGTSYDNTYHRLIDFPEITDYDLNYLTSLSETQISAGSDFAGILAAFAFTPLTGSSTTDNMTLTIGNYSGVTTGTYDGINSYVQSQVNYSDEIRIVEFIIKSRSHGHITGLNFASKPLYPLPKNAIDCNNLIPKKTRSYDKEGTGVETVNVLYDNTDLTAPDLSTTMYNNWSTGSKYKNFIELMAGPSIILPWDDSPVTSNVYMDSDGHWQLSNSFLTTLSTNVFTLSDLEKAITEASSYDPFSGKDWQEQIVSLPVPKKPVFGGWTGALLTNVNTDVDNLTKMDKAVTAFNKQVQIYGQKWYMSQLRAYLLMRQFLSDYLLTRAKYFFKRIKKSHKNKHTFSLIYDHVAGDITAMMNLINGEIQKTFGQWMKIECQFRIQETTDGYSETRSAAVDKIIKNVRTGLNPALINVGALGELEFLVPEMKEKLLTVTNGFDMPNTMTSGIYEGFIKKIKKPVYETVEKVFTSAYGYDDPTPAYEALLKEKQTMIDRAMTYVMVGSVVLMIVTMVIPGLDVLTTGFMVGVAAAEAGMTALEVAEVVAESVVVSVLGEGSTAAVEMTAEEAADIGLDTAADTAVETTDDVTADSTELIEDSADNTGDDDECTFGGGYISFFGGGKCGVRVNSSLMDDAAGLAEDEPLVSSQVYTNSATRALQGVKDVVVRGVSMFSDLGEAALNVCPVEPCGSNAIFQGLLKLNDEAEELAAEIARLQRLIADSTAGTPLAQLQSQLAALQSGATDAVEGLNPEEIAAKIKKLTMMIADSTESTDVTALQAELDALKQGAMTTIDGQEGLLADLNGMQVTEAQAELLNQCDLDCTEVANDIRNTNAARRYMALQLAKQSERAAAMTASNVGATTDGPTTTILTRFTSTRSLSVVETLTGGTAAPL